jgi:2'-hydroxyisoflavone reductase
MKILILGGTQFLGPACMDAALARGHTVTLFNRGRIEAKKHLKLPAGVDVLYGNRDPNKTADEEWNPDKGGDSPKGLSQLEGKKWDAVIDTSGYVPRIVKASAELLAPNVGQYLFISSVSAYKEGFAPGTDETAELATLKDPTTESMGAQFQNYGGLKVLCEQAAEAAMPKRVTVVRPGFIVGPGDPTDRFTYWPVRMTEAVEFRKEVLCPGAESDPIQIIDVRDLGEWIVTLLENKTMGAFDALGPQTGRPDSLTWGHTLAACKSAAKSEAEFVWVPAEFIEEQHLSPGGDLPIWVPPIGDSAGFHQRNIARAVAAGLKFRPIEQTCADTLAWWKEEIPRREQLLKEAQEEARAKDKPVPNPPRPPSQPRAGLTPERESEVLSAWKMKQHGG